MLELLLDMLDLAAENKLRTTMYLMLIGLFAVTSKLNPAPADWQGMTLGLGLLAIGIMITAQTALDAEAAAKSEQYLFERGLELVHKLRITTEELNVTRIALEVAEALMREPQPLPCGHAAQYGYTEDGGSHSICLLCEHNDLKEAGTPDAV
jgi:hypothetical protein